VEKKTTNKKKTTARKRVGRREEGSVFKYAYQPPSNLCTATNISKSSHPPSPHGGTEEDDGLPRDGYDNNAGLLHRRTDGGWEGRGEQGKERNGSCGNTSRADKA